MARRLASLSSPTLFGFRSNQFGFNISAASGETLVIEASSDLQTWTALSTNTLTSPTFYFLDPATMPFPQHFYRVRLQ